MSGAPSPLSSSAQSLLEQKRADNELSELERHLLLRTISLDRELEKRDKQHEAEKEELQKKLAKANRWSLASEREVERLLAELSADLNHAMVGGETPYRC